MGPVERSLRRWIAPRTVMDTLAGDTVCVVERLDETGLMLSSSSEVRTHLAWTGFEGVPEFLRGRGWALVGGSAGDTQGTLEGYLKKWGVCGAGPLVARLLAAAGIIETELGPPLRIRL